jgi:hypothetical protein
MNILRQRSIMFDGERYLRNVGNVVTIGATQYGERSGLKAAPYR